MTKFWISRCCKKFKFNVVTTFQLFYRWVDALLAPILAVLATILIFMDQQITAVIVNRKEHQLNKGGGYHLDLLVLALIIVVCSVFGLPWFVAGTVAYF